MKKSKRLIAAILSVIMAAALAATPLYATESNDWTFTDVCENDWYYDAVKYACENGIVDGVSDDLFAPELPVTRAMAVTMLYRMAGEPTMDDEKDMAWIWGDDYIVDTVQFRDIASNSWYENAVAWAAQNRIVNGRAEGTFAPLANMTRAEFAAVLTRYAADNYLSLPSARKEEKKFADEAAIPDYARLSVRYLYDAKIIEGKTENTFDPNATITRAEAVTMLKRFSDAAVDLQKQHGIQFSPLALEIYSNYGNGRHVVELFFEFIASDDAHLPEIKGNAVIYYSASNGSGTFTIDVDNLEEPELPTIVYGEIPDSFKFYANYINRAEVSMNLTIEDQAYVLIMNPIITLWS